LTFENVAVYVPEFALAAGFIVFPVTFIASTIRPDLDSIAMLHISQPVAFINSSILKHNFTSLFKLSHVWVICQRRISSLTVLTVFLT
jgi:hypothetical protein